VAVVAADTKAAVKPLLRLEVQVAAVREVIIRLARVVLEQLILVEAVEAELTVLSHQVILQREELGVLALLSLGIQGLSEVQAAQ
jgi:hypothetical protein